MFFVKTPKKLKEMIKNFVKIIVIAVAFTACAGNAEKGTSENTEATELNSSEAEVPEIILADFGAKAGDFVDKEVKVAGLVDHVCKQGGKKLFLVSEEADLHVEGEERFDESLSGSSVIVTGYVREFRVDEAYCLKMEEDNITSHSKGATDDELYARKMETVQWYRDSMQTANTDHLSFYSLEYKSLVVVEPAAMTDDQEEEGEATETEEI